MQGDVGVFFQFQSRGRVESKSDAVVYPMCSIEPPDMLHHHTSRQMPAHACRQERQVSRTVLASYCITTAVRAYLQGYWY